MSMTREEAIELLRDTPIDIRSTREDDIHTLYATAQMMAIDALRPVSREQVEKMWRGEWMALDECSNEGVYCKRCKKKVYRIEYTNEKMRSPFCPACGAAQTDEAVQSNPLDATSRTARKGEQP